MEFNGKEYIIKVWQGEELANFLAIDTETMVVPFTETPDLITCQVFDGESLFYIERCDLDKFLQMHSEKNFIFANAPFDIDVLEKATNWKCNKQIEQGKIYDVLVMYRLYILAVRGVVPRRFSLAKISEEFLQVSLSKEEEIRNNFGRFKEKKIKDIPREFLEYGASDVIATHDVFYQLLNRINCTKSTTLLSHNIQVAGNLALNRIYKNGIGVDRKKAEELLVQIERELRILGIKLSTYGWVRGEKGNQKFYNEIIEYLGLDEKLPKTATGGYSMKEDDLVAHRNIPFIDMYLKYKSLEKTTHFLKNLDSDKVHPRYDLLKNTGRTSCSSPNFQQLPRDGDIRSMFKAAEGSTFIITDYSAIELSTLAQVLYDEFRHSVMRDKINEGADLHRYYASVLFGVEEHKVEKWQRQAAKAANFGFPGGLGTETFTKFAKGYGIDITESEARNMRDAWFNAFPEMKEYLKGEKGYVITRTGRVRANTTFCAEKNTPFQGLAADGAKIALYNLMEAGFKIVGFVHDEIITEVPKNRIKDLTKQQEKIMIDSMKVVVPDVVIKVESTISERYCK